MSAADATPAAPSGSAIVAEPSAAASSSTAAAAASSSSASAAASAPLPASDHLTKLMIDKSLSMLASHKAVASRGIGMLLRNLFGILFGPMFSQSWETHLMREEQKNTKVSFQRINETSLKRMNAFFSSKKVRAKSGSSLALALINPTAKTESFEHRLTFVWLGGATNPRLFKIDGMKRSGVLGLTTEQTTWPVLCTECPSQGADIWSALQVFITAGNPKAEWDKEKQAAWDVIIAQHGPNSKSIPFASRIELKGPQIFCCVTNDEEGLQVDLKNGLVERLKAISQQLEAMPQ